MSSKSWFWTIVYNIKDLHTVSQVHKSELVWTLNWASIGTYNRFETWFFMSKNLWIIGYPFASLVKIGQKYLHHKTIVKKNDKRKTSIAFWDNRIMGVAQRRSPWGNIKGSFVWRYFLRVLIVVRATIL